MQDTTSLLLRIARCPNVPKCLEGTARHPCSKVVASQGVGSRDEFQLPEPWTGRIDEAPILFISSNPSFGPLPYDFFPRWRWLGAAITEYFTYRFGGPTGQMARIADGNRSLVAEGRYGKAVLYWSWIRNRAQELLPGHTVQPGIDYALSEVVHCKSLSERGVPEALKECAARYLEPVLAASGALVVVCVGRFAGKAIRRQFTIPAELHEPVLIGGRGRHVAFLPGPSSALPKTFAGTLSAERLSFLRAVLATG